jgi:predicted transcriptional regulator
MKINTKQIGKFLANLNGAEYMYLKHCIDIRDNINRLIEKFSLSPDQTCDIFNITPAKLQDYISGNYNYSLEGMAHLNAAFMKLESEALENKVPVKVAQ